MLSLVALISVSLLLFGCAGETKTSTGDPSVAPSLPSTSPGPSEPLPEEEPTAPPAPAVSRTTVAVYLMGKDEKLHPVARRIDAPATVRAALASLAEGPTADERQRGLVSSLPKGTRVLGVSSAGDGVYTVDLSSEFGSGGGSLSMMSRVAQVVYTATRFPSVKRLAFRIDGKPVEALGGEGIVIEEPQGRADWESFSPAILVESPLPEGAMKSPVRIRGTANVFEAVFQLEIVDGDGLIVATKRVEASSGTGTRGTFDTTIAFGEAKPGNGEIVASYRSAKDGKRVVVDEIPVVFGE